MLKDESDFSMFFQAQYAAVARVAYLMTGDRVTAEDMTQEAFVRLYARWGRVSRYERPDAWVRTVAMRLAQRGARKRRAEQHAPSEGEAAQEPRHDTELWDAVLSLPRGQRAAVVLHYYEDKPVDEVATILGCSASTARVHLHKARKRLAVLLGEETADV